MDVHPVFDIVRSKALALAQETSSDAVFAGAEALARDAADTASDLSSHRRENMRLELELEHLYEVLATANHGMANRDAAISRLTKFAHVSCLNCPAQGNVCNGDFTGRTADECAESRKEWAFTK